MFTSTFSELHSFEHKKLNKNILMIDYFKMKSRNLKRVPVTVNFLTDLNRKIKNS